MANDITLPGTGQTIATLDRAGVEYQKVIVELGNNASVDAFARLRVSNPVTLFDSKSITLDKKPLFWDESLETGAGITASTPTAAKPYSDVTSTTSTAGKFTRQTFRRFNYQPGKSQLILMTGVIDLSGGGAGVERRIGYFDDDNGVFFEMDNATMGVTTRSNDTGTPIDTTVTQASWNIDTLDGSGNTGNPTSMLVDWTKAQIFVIDFQWLSVGRVRLGIEVGGSVCYIHEFLHANLQTIPWASTPNLPLREQMITTGSSPASSMRVICAAVISEGGEDLVGLTNSEATIDHVNANTQNTVYALVGVKLKSTHLGCTFELTGVSMLSETADNFEWQLIHNATVAGTFTYADKTDSCMQTVVGDSSSSPSTNTVTGGTIISRGFGASSSGVTLKLETSLSLGAAIDGTRDTLVLAVRPLGANADIQGAVNWREII